MKIIEYRAWDKEYNRMLSPENVEIRVLNQIIRDYVLMQYTNINDKNDNKIFVGDIVKATDFDQDILISDIIQNDEGRFEVRYQGNRTYNFGLPVKWTGWNSVEVIGNIYENKELIKQLGLVKRNNG